MPTPSTIYGAALKHLWGDDGDGTYWTDDVGGMTLTAPGGLEPAVDTTPGGRLAFAFDGSDGDIMSGTSALSLSGFTSAQWGCAFYAPSAPTVGFSALMQILGGYFLHRIDNPSTSTIYVPDGQSLTSAITFGAWNTLVVDYRGGADVLTNPARVYVNETLAVNVTSAMGTDLAADVFPFATSDLSIGAGNDDDVSFKIARPFIAYKSSDFTLTTTALAMGAYLRSVLRHEAEASLTIDAFTLSAATIARAGAALSVSLDGFGLTATAIAPAACSASLTIDPFTLSAVAEGVDDTANCTVDVTIDPFTLAAEAVAIAQCSLELSIDPFSYAVEVMAVAQCELELELDPFQLDSNIAITPLAHSPGWAGVPAIVKPTQSIELVDSGEVSFTFLKG